MLRRVLSALAAASFFAAPSASAAVHSITAQLSDHGAGYSGSTTSTGTGTFTYDDQSHILSGTIAHDLANGYWYGIAHGTYSNPLVSDPLVSNQLIPVGSSPINISISLDAVREQQLFAGQLFAFIPVASGPRIDGPLVAVSATSDAGSIDASKLDGGGDAAGGNDFPRPDDGGRRPVDYVEASDRAYDPPSVPADNTDVVNIPSSRGCACSSTDGSVPSGLAPLVVGLVALGLRRRRRPQ